MLTQTARALTLSAVIATSLIGCDPYQEPQPRRDQMNFPIGLALHPSNDYLYVVNSNFDSRYSPEQGGTVSIVDTNTYQLRAEGTPFIPSFGANIKLNGNASKAYVTARRGDVVVALDVASSPGAGLGSALTCPDNEGRPSSDSTRCVMHRVPDVQGAPRLPVDPFGLEVTTVTRRDAAGEDFLVDVVAVSHLVGAAVSTISLPRQDRAAATLLSAPLSGLVAGSNQVAVRPGTLEMYVTGRGSDRVSVFVPFLDAEGRVEAMFIRRTIALSNAANTVDSRGIAFNAAGDALYVTTRRPDALHVFALTPSNLEDGTGVDHRLQRVIPIGDQPTDVIVHRTPEGRELLLIPCYDAKSIYVVDPNQGVVVSVIALDERPYQLVVERGAGFCEVPGQRCRAYVSLFADASQLSTSCDDSMEGCGSVAVLELDPGSERYLQVIAKIR